MATKLNPLGYGRQKPMGGGFETFSWYFMRVSGAVLLLIAVFHLLLMHIGIKVENIDFSTVEARWTGPWGPFWRVYDLALLTFALFHGFNGLRWVLDDYIHSPGWNKLVKSVVYVVGVIVVLMGAYVIFSFKAG
ncbi:MAG: succinate dehydrogenase [Chloroflexi bacterium]|nr:MAG: succinate dehydrogenase [Chloroflexota bacterium]